MEKIRYIGLNAIVVILSVVGLLLIVSCEKNEVVNDEEQYISEDVPEVYRKIYGANQIYIDGNYVVIKCNGIPDHKSPYFYGTQWESEKYEAYNASGFHQNPNSISSQSLIFKIPLEPREAGSKSATPMGPIGVSLNGVPFFNQYAAGGTALDNEIVSFDQYYGHPAPNNMYHYHAEPTYLTITKGDDQLLGFLLDGYPVYGPRENGATVSNNDLDAYHGHTHATADYPDGIYHYHVTNQAPYINGDGFYGMAGTVAQ